jgi:hypothetical protein
LLDALEGVAIEGREPPNDRVRDLVRSIHVTDLRYPRYTSEFAPDMDALSESDVLILDQIAATYGGKSFDELRDLTHGMAAYTRAWRDNDVRKKFRMSFEDFFAEVPDKADFLKQIAEEQFLHEIFPPPKCLIAKTSVRSTF